MRQPEYEVLRAKYLRLKAAAEDVVAGAEAAGNFEHPKCQLEPHLIRNLRRELQHEPAPSGLTFMSVS